MRKIYLAGPMTGLAYKDAEMWRTEVQVRFMQIPGLMVLNPSRDTDLKPETVYQANGSELNPNGLTNPRALRARNLYDVEQADLIFVNFLGATRVSLGTAYEIGYAAALSKPVVCVMEPSGNPHDHLMLAPGLEYRFDNLPDAFRAVLSIFGSRAPY